MKRFALAGNPNCGKTTLFNSLTGSTAHVGNWPGVTVDKKEGTYKKCAEPIAIVDLPGIYSLSPYTPEEVISRNYVLDEKPDCVINIVDATNLERNLYLTTQIMEIDVPMVIALNMMDAVEKNGDKIDAKSLEEKIGLPVVEISALREKGLDELMQRAYEVCGQPRKGRTVLEGTQLTHLINDCRIALDGSGVENSLFHAVKLVELDEIEVGQHPQAAQMVEEFKKTFKDDVFGTDFEAIVADSRYKYISKNYSTVLTKKEKTEKEKLRVEDCLRSRRRGHAHGGRGRTHDRPAQFRHAPPSAVRHGSAQEREAGRTGASRFAGCGMRSHRLHGSGREGLEGAWREGGLGASGDIA